MARGLLALHNGRITMHSAGIGRGTEVTFDLPVDPANRVVEQPSTSRPPMVRRRILIIEDYPDAAASLRDLLALEGHEVRAAADGSTGLALVRTFDPELVLCDLGLPGIDGYAVARAIRADPQLRARRVVAISGYAQPDDVAHARDSGFDEHIAKPVTLDSLQKLLASIGGSPG